MVPKIITYAALVVAQNKKDRIRVLGRGFRLKSKRHSPSVNLSDSSLHQRARHKFGQAVEGNIE